ncbi:MAG: transglutaminase-like domain-containing protein [Oscillospiraceae bacterium]|nr:transglutaminase-like domain-containing protein [Oscillospiraceae bacterium]
MNIGNSGKAPERSKIIAALLALTIVLTGCQPQTVSSGGDPPSSVSSVTAETSDASTDVSTDDNTHVPETSDTPGVPDDTSSGVSESTDSSDSSTSSLENSTAESPGSESTSASVSSEPAETSEVSSVVSSNETSSSEPPASSSSVEPDPPPVVDIPDVKVPTSPGSQLITGTSGVIDCSNVSLGYVSARYTGSSSKLKFRVEANGQTPDDFDLSTDGSTEYFPLEFGNGTYTLTIFEQIPGATGYAVAAQGTVDVQLASSLSPYLYPNRYVNYGQNSDCVYKAAELCAGKTTDIDKIAAIFTWVANNISYDYDLAATVTSGYIPDPDRTLSRRTGICFDYASLMAAMLRSQSIPSRLVIGYAAPDIYHAWNEVYTEQTGWITPELMFKNAGYNIADATFYSTTPDKAQIAAYISNNGNYAATKYR